MPLPSPDRLALLYHVSQTFNSTLELDQVLQHVMDEVITATQAERGFLMLRNDDAQLEFRVARGMDQHTIASPEFQISRGLVERVANEGLPLLTSDAQSDVWLKGRASVAGLGLRSILCVPLQVKGTTIGVVYVDNRLQAGIFEPDDLDLLSTIGATAATAIENARLYQIAVEKGRMERELEVARQVQSSLIPAARLEFPGWDVAAWWQPARVVSGDFYDFFKLPAGPHPEPLQGLVIADVSDKGMGAALFMALTRTLVRASAIGASAVGASTPAESITQANRVICDDTANGMFVTLCYACLEPGAGDLTYVNAGHNPPLLYRADTAQLFELERTGIALGIRDSEKYTQRTVHLDAGDFVLFYTDGLLDATNSEDVSFGEARLQATIQANGRSSAAAIVETLERTLREFTGAAPQFDDMTLVVAKRL